MNSGKCRSKVKTYTFSKQTEIVFILTVYTSILAVFLWLIESGLGWINRTSFGKRMKKLPQLPFATQQVIEGGPLIWSNKLASAWNNNSKNYFCKFEFRHSSMATIFYCLTSLAVNERLEMYVHSHFKSLFSRAWQSMKSVNT